MEPSTVNLGRWAATSKLFARRLLTIGENRLELLVVEMQEERERLLHTFLLVIGIGAVGLLAAITLTAAIVVFLWNCSPGLVLLTLTGLYGTTGVCLAWRLHRLLRNWETLSASRDQLRKDRECLEKILA